MVVHACNPSYSVGVGRSLTPVTNAVQKKTRADLTNRASVAQMIECFPNKYRACVQNSGTTKKNNISK
jgi:hypothetical protein